MTKYFGRNLLTVLVVSKQLITLQNEKHNRKFAATKTTDMKEKIVRTIIETIFIIRYWVILFLLGGLIYLTYYVYHLPNVSIKDTVAVFTGGAVVITLFYHILNYEYAQRKFKHDVKSSKDLLSFNTAMEWQKEFLTKNLSTLYVFYTKNKSFLEDGMPRKFQEELDKPENNDSYNALLTVLNFTESVCLGVKQGIMDEEFIMGFFKTVFISQYNRYYTYIEYRRREKQNPKIWHNFTELSNKWINCK